MHTFRRNTVIVLILSFIWPHQLVAHTEGPALSPEEPAYAKLIAHLQDKIDQGRLDTGAALDQLDYEPEQVLQFLREQIRFEQYPGTLRGALGTLASRAGNALDQALLLATLLRDAGADARIVHGELSATEARRLLDQMRRETLNGSKEFDLAGVEELLSRTDHPDVGSWLDPAAPPPETREMIEDVSAMISKAAPATRSETQVIDQLIEEARDYFWVEYRDAEAQPWTAAHTAFPIEAQPQPTVKAYFADSVPAAFQHRFRLRVFIESLIGDKLQTQQLAPEWERPVANMTGRAFSFSNQAVDLDVDADDPDFAAKFNSRMQQASMFVPMINGRIQPGSKGFDLDGVVFDVEAMQMSAGQGELFRTEGKKVDSAAAAISALGSTGGREKMRYLTAQWLEYSLITPAGEERTYRRYLYDSIGPARRESGDLDGLSLESAQPSDLMASESYVVETGALPPDRVLQEYTRWMETLHELAVQRAEKGQLTLADYHRAQQRLQGTEGLKLFSLLRYFDASLEGDEAATYRSAPTLLALHVSVTGQDELKLSTDIMSNDRRSRDWQQPALARSQVIRRGVWESWAERHALREWAQSGKLVSPFAGLEPGGTPDGVLVPAEHIAIKRQLSADARTLMRIDARHGPVLMTASVDPGQPSWWRVDEVSGAVIGVLADGRGSIKVEYKILLGLAIAFVGALAYHAASVCTKLLAAEWKVCVGTAFNVITGNMAQPYTDAYADECLWENLAPWSDPGEPRCRCGGINQPQCPDWQQPF